MPEMSPPPEENPLLLKSELQRVITAAYAKETVAMLDRLWGADRFAIRRAPQTGLTMITAVDPFDTPFYLGEILMTSAEVMLDEQVGYGAVSGEAPSQALLLAAVEAAERGGHTAEFCGLGDFIERLARRHDGHHERSARIAAATEVQFATMRQEKVDFGSLGE
jgi:phosphonate C-P lyase system protein PhnG